MWHLIFLNLTNSNDLCSVSQVCKLFHQIVANDLNFLSTLVELHFGVQNDLNTKKDFIHFFNLASYFTKFEQFSPW